MLVLFIPIIQYNLVLVPEQPLEPGSEAIKLTAESWFSGKYQKSKEENVKNTIPFRDELVRLSNQVYYSLFNEGRGNSVVVGKEQSLLLQGQIDALYGLDYVGLDSIRIQTEKLLYIRDQLQKKGIQLAIAIVPSKAKFHSDLIPDWKRVYHPDTTNYDMYLDEWRRQDINYFDATPWLLNKEKSDSSRYFPQNGLHYGQYAQLLIMDSLAGYLQTKTGMNFPRIEIGALNEAAEVMVEEDEDQEKYMTIFSSIKDEPMAYPAFEISTPDGDKPSVLTVGDSYFMGMSNLDLNRKVFGDGQFWYYNHQIRTKPNVIDRYTNNVDLVKEVEKHDVVLLFLAEANLYRFCFGFVDQLEDAYKNRRKYRINYFINQINSNKEWLTEVENKAIEKGISLEEMVRLDAEFLFNQESDF